MQDSVNEREIRGLLLEAAAAPGERQKASSDILVKRKIRKEGF